MRKPAAGLRCFLLASAKCLGPLIIANRQMKLLERLSLDNGELPRPADQRRLSLGLESWRAALTVESGPAAAAARNWSCSPPGERLLAAIFGNSPFLSGLAVREWQFLTRLVEAGPDALFAGIVEPVEDPVDHREDTPALMRRLRIAKRRTALLAAVAELAGVWSLEQQTAALSRFAEAAIGAALRHLLREAVSKSRIVLTDTADPEHDSGLIVLGMGKLGAGELNYSSDIDLILFFDPAKSQVNARDGTQPFFSRLARDLVRILEERTGDGYVFRTDLRLRPDPGSTPLAMSVAAAHRLLRKRRPELGTRRADQGAAGRRRPHRWRAVAARALPVYLAKASRFRGDPGHSFDQTPDQRLSRRRPDRGREVMISRSAAAASARSSFSPRPSS